MPTTTQVPTVTPTPTTAQISTITPTATANQIVTPTPTVVPTQTPTPTPTVRSILPAILRPTATPASTPTPMPTPTPAPPFVSVSSGGRNACGLRSDGTVVCQGESEYSDDSPNVRFNSINHSDTHACGLREDGVAVCWGTEVGIAFLLRPGSLLKDERFKRISVGRYHNCGLLEEEVRTPAYLGGRRIGDHVDVIEVVACWASNAQGWSLPSSDVRFTSISTSSLETCALREDGITVCWGSSTEGLQPSPPADERFIFISSGDRHACGLRKDGSVICWGEIASPPEDERFMSISSGQDNACGLRKDGRAVCWGSIAPPPAYARFTSISSGTIHGCGLRENSTMLCWGDGLWDQFSPEDERFISVSSGDWHTCAVREEGTIVCWGSLSWEDIENIEEAPEPGYGLGVDFSRARSSFERLGFKFESVDREDGRPAMFGRKPPDHTRDPGESIEIVLIGDDRGVEEAHLMFSHDTELLSPGIMTFIQIMSNGRLTDIDWMVNDFFTERKNPSVVRIEDVTVEATLLADSVRMIFKR